MSDLEELDKILRKLNNYPLDLWKENAHAIHMIIGTLRICLWGRSESCNFARISIEWPGGEKLIHIPDKRVTDLYKSVVEHLRKMKIEAEIQQKEAYKRFLDE